MSRKKFKRPAHLQIQALLSKLNKAFLDEAKCYFGGGTRIVLELGEYRESRDIDFMCSDREGYRLLRESVSETSLGHIQTPAVSLARDVRADQYGIRTFLNNNGDKLKLEIFHEARIDIEGAQISSIPVMCLTRRLCFAEKFLANTDRGLDASTLSRDIIDLAFMIEGWSNDDATVGLAMAQAAYGTSVLRALAAVTEKMRSDKTYRHRCIDGLAISEPKVLTAGVKTLTEFRVQSG